MLRRRSIVVGTVCVALATAAGCGGDDTGSGRAEPASTPEATQQAAANGKKLFSNTCGGCHTLADAGTTGAVGPNLDDLGPDHDQVLTALRSGPGAMPENLLVGEEAEAVAEYVSTSAGQ